MKTITERKEELLTSRSVPGDIRLFLMSFMTLGAGVGVLVGVCVCRCGGRVCVCVCFRVLYPA